MKSTILKDTQRYVSSFDSKNLSDVTDFFVSNSSLFDPGNPDGVHGKEDIVKMISQLFDDIKELKFEAKDIFCDEEKLTSIIEFKITLDGKELKGADIIKWQDSKILELRAYLY